jgi:hypothetical protein
VTNLEHSGLDRVLPPALGSPDWAEVMDRARAGQRRRRQRLVALAAAALVIVTGTASAFGTVRDFFLDRGFIGLAPPGATPSAPESGELVISYFGPTPEVLRKLVAGERTANPELTANPGDSHVWVYADGRLIWTRHGDDIPEGANPLFTGFLQQRLTPEGVELMRSEIVSSALVRHDRPVGFDPLIQVRDGDRLLFVEHPQRDFEELAEIERLITLITEPTSRLPASAWKTREIRAYVASRYAVCVRGNSQPFEPDRLLTLLPARARDLLVTAGFYRYRPPGPPEYAHAFACSDMKPEEARELDETLAAAGLEQEGGGEGRGREAVYTLVYRLDTPNLPDTISIFFEPYLPHGQWICAACG